MNVATPFSIHKACKKIFDIFCSATSFYNTSYGSRSSSALVYKQLTSTMPWHIQCFWCVAEQVSSHLTVTVLCSLMETFVKGRETGNSKMPAKPIWVSEKRKVLFELSMKNAWKERRVLFKETFCYFSDKNYIGELGLKVPIARSDLKNGAL